MLWRYLRRYMESSRKAIENYRKWLENTGAPKNVIETKVRNMETNMLPYVHKE